MNKKLFVMCVFLTIATPAIVFGAAEELTTGATTITNTNGANGGPNLTFDPSPNVSLEAYTTVTAYAITSTNVLTNAANGMVYGTLSSSTGYAQRQKTAADVTAGTAPPPTVETGLPGTAGSWNWMGGS